jgi:hypothetical protein
MERPARTMSRAQLEVTMGGRTMRVLARMAGVAVLLAAVPALGAAPADAATYACSTRTTVKSFAAYGDDNDYFLVPDGSFENGATSWTLSPGTVSVKGNTPAKVLGGANKKSLYVPELGSAVTPTMCLTHREDSIRFHYKAPGIPGAVLRVGIQVTSATGVATSTVDVVGSSNGWSVSPRIMLPDVRDATGTQYVTVSFSSQGIPAGWQLDDVQVDPWRSL